MTKRIECPKCGHKGSYIVSIWGTGNVTLDPETGEKLVSAKSYDVEDQDYCECPECGLKSYFANDFIQS